jgi:hypothetical protein
MPFYRTSLLTSVLVVALLAPACFGQQESLSTPNPFGEYDVRRETTLVGTVLAYTSGSPNPSPGPHVSLQTANGAIDVHLGDARFLAASHFVFQPGDTLRIIGEPVAHGSSTQFVARIIQKGTQALAVRTVRGFPLSYVAPRGENSQSQSGGVAR